MKILIPLLIVALLYSCTETKSIDLDFFVGTWKRENKELYEVWTKDKPGELKGYSFRNKDGQRMVTETLVIRKIGNKYVFEATVPDQNDGQTIQFWLNSQADSLYSFENAKHDFPKKIQYKRLDLNRIKVNVLGDDAEGFSYIQIRQKGDE